MPWSSAHRAGPPMQFGMSRRYSPKTGPIMLVRTRMSSPDRRKIMSHVSVGAAVINDNELELEALALACKEVGLVFCRGVKEYKWYGRWVRDYHADDAAYRHGVRPEDYGKCEHMIRLSQTMHDEEVYARNPDARPYEIGLVRTGDGKFQLVLDH